MLTLKAPIQLHTDLGLTGNAESFSQRIQGNYGLLGAKYTPKDLLFLLTATPELPEELGGMTTLVAQQTNVDARTITMDVVTNVINRIMLDGTSQFTYQDQVYITNVLTRLGVTNVEQFMSQVRQLRAESESTVHLTRLYRAQLERVIQQKQAGEQTPELPVGGEVVREETVVQQDPRVTLSMEILQRMNISQIYETIHAFQRNWTFGGNHFQRNELRLSEQLRFSNSVSLAQMKQQIYQQSQLNLQHHYNQYEAGTIVELPHSEEQVLSQAAVAALVNAVDNTVTQVLNRPEIRQEQWLRIENSLWQSAQNSLSRFESYHTSEQLPPTATAPDIQIAWNQYAQELREYLDIHQQLQVKGVQPGPMPLPPAGANLLMQHLFRVEEGDEIAQEMQYSTNVQQESRQTLVEQVRERMDIYHQLQPGEDRSGPVSSTPAAGDVPMTHLTRVDEGDEVTQETMQDIHVLQEENKTQIQQLLDMRQEKKVSTEKLRDRESLVYRDTLEREQERLRELQTKETATTRPGRDEIRVELAPPTVPTSETKAVEPSLPPMELTAREAEELAPDVLVERLEQIDRQNKTVYQTIQQISAATSMPPMPKGADMRRTMENSLRALEEPDLVLREIFEEGAREKSQESIFTPKEEAILKQVSPQTRTLYERVLAYHKNPEAAVAQGLVKPGTLGGLNAELKLAVAEVPEMEAQVEVVRETQRLQEETETVLERILHLPTKSRTEEYRVTPPSAVHIVHKQAPPDITEELLERMTQQRTQQMVREESVEEINRQNVRQTDITQTEKQVIHQTTQDITELVNRTMVKQMRTLSDQFYRQMEKRLQAERSRRGRM